MKFTSLLTLLPFLTAAIAAPNPEPQPINPGEHIIDKRSVTAEVTASALKYRTCPRTSCTPVGQYSKGTRVTVECVTNKDTTSVEGDAYWSKLANGYYASNFYLEYISGEIITCK